MRRKPLCVRLFFVCLISAMLALTAFAQEQKITEGSLQVIDEKGNNKGLCPLKHTSVSAHISGFISRVTVTQEFQNPFNQAIEAAYVFPLPNDAAVDDMSIQIGERLIKGKTFERGEAMQIYQAAKKEGKVAAILTQERLNIFTQAVSNITPSANIKVIISYVETLKYADDTDEFSFPMTVGDRYISSSATVADAARISPPSEALPPHTISLQVELDAGVPMENVISATHRVQAQQFSASQFKVNLENEAEIPNRDFVLRYKTAGVKISDAVLAHRDERGVFFTLILQSLDKVMPADTTPKEIVFVLDTSGSMEGFPIEKAKDESGVGRIKSRRYV